MDGCILGLFCLLESSSTDTKIRLSGEADPSFLSPLQVCCADDQQWSLGPGVAGVEGVHHPAYHQHREEHHGVYVAPRP